MMINYYICNKLYLYTERLKKISLLLGLFLNFNKLLRTKSVKILFLIAKAEITIVIELLSSNGYVLCKILPFKNLFSTI